MWRSSWPSPSVGLAALCPSREARSVNVEDTGLARLVHARLYGSELPYETHGMDTLVENYNAVVDKNREADDYYFFETCAVRFNLCMVNTGHEALDDVSVLLTFPWADSFRVADRIIAWSRSQGWNYGIGLRGG